MNRFQGTEHRPDVPKRSASFSFANSATFWFALIAVGMALLLAGLGIDVYRQNHGTTGESLLNLWNPGHLLAAAGIALSTLSALAGLTVCALRGIDTRPALLRRAAPVTAAWVLIAAIGVGSLTYIAGNSGNAGSPALATAEVHNHSETTAPTSDPESGGIVQGLQANGIATDSGDSGSSSTTLGQQAADPHAGHVHDAGKQPTYTQIETMTDKQLLPLFPAGTMTLADIPKLRTQLEEVHAVALKYPTADDAKAAGYVNTTSDVPYMGEHYINFNILRSGKFDPNSPSGLLYSKIGPGGQEQLVGIWYLMVPGIGGITAATPPTNTWAGNIALWHEHDGLCLVGTSSASEGETAASCKAKGGAYTAALKWMLHVWVVPGHENSDGVFAYLNNDLFAQQQAAGNTAAPIAQQNGTIAQ
ncbi:MAG TPA: hypothetical protein VIE40_05355 [Dehalococcoidia bacterium]|jgi:hypothetical protein